MIEEFWWVLIFLFGACVGSFLNVVILRLPRKKSIIEPSSRCGRCRSAIPSYLNLPILAYFLARGRCAKCGRSFSFRYAVVEFLVGLVFLALWINYSWSEEFLIFSIFSCLLIAASVIDLDLKLIPDEINWGGILVFLFLALFVSPTWNLEWSESWVDSIWQNVAVVHPFWVSALGASFGYSLLWLISRSFYWLTGDEGLGLGDAKLMAMIGAVLGVKGVILSITLGALLGSLVGIILIVGLPKERRRRYQIPFGPFLCFGAFVGVFQFDWIFWSWVFWGQNF
jgi:leader peptidase (prepilin peptidase)/N-methyltransferase